MKILTSQALHELERETCEIQKINTIDIMERAASAASVEIVSRFLPSRRIVVMAGPYNNGGVALATARMLIEQGYRNLEVFFFNVSGQVSHDCDEERKKLITIDGLDFTEVNIRFNFPNLGKEDVLVDGLFGSELGEKMSQGFVKVAEMINASGAYVISLDLPSGLFGEENNHVLRREMVHANLTLVFELPRLSLFFEENHEVVGDWKLIDLDLDEDRIKALKPQYMVVEPRNVKALFKTRAPFSGKRDYGSVLLFAGSTGMTGAAVLASGATLRAGAGLTTVHGPYGSIDIVQTAVPEVMFEPDRNEHFISDMTVHHKHQVVAAGPGIGTREQTIDALESLLKNVPNALILDADALNCIAKRPTMLSLLPPKTIITPHTGEFDRLFGEHNTAEDRLKTAIAMARQYNIVIVLKGHYTMTVRPATGRVDINTTGNSGMATAGSGDVLTGVISAFLAQGYPPEHAATIGVYVHGLAGDIAAEELGEYGITASEISKRVGRAIRRVLRGEAGITLG